MFVAGQEDDVVDALIDDMRQQFVHGAGEAVPGIRVQRMGGMAEGAQAARQENRWRDDEQWRALGGWLAPAQPTFECSELGRRHESER